MSTSDTTTDHKKIKKWIEDRDGRPSVVEATENNGKGGGLLRVDFREKDDALDEIDWDRFFKIFDDNKLAFLHQDKTKDGEISRFNKFVARED
jgi:hypothetical protein